MSDGEQLGFPLATGLHREAILKMMAINADELIEGFLASSGVSLLSGPTASGKSLLALDVALTLISGAPDWHGRAIWDPHPRRVLYVDAENGHRVAFPRTLAWTIDRDWSDDDTGEQGLMQRRLLFSTRPRARLGLVEDSASEAVGQIVGKLSAFEEKLDLVILDTLAALQSSDDTSSNAQTQRVMHDADLISSKYGVPVLMVAHPSKVGASALEAAMRAGERPSDQSLVSGAQRAVDVMQFATAMCRGPKNNNVRLMAQAKARCGTQFEDVAVFRLRGVELETMQVTTEIRGEQRTFEPRIESRPVVARGEFGVVEKVKETKFPLFVKWLVDNGFTSSDEAAVRADIEGSGRSKTRAPIGFNTASGYCRQDTYETERVRLGLMSERVPNPGGGQPSLHIWVEQPSADVAAENDQ